MIATLAAYFALFIPFVLSRPTVNALNSTQDLVVDLGYQTNRGRYVVDNTLVTFRNIRYAAPPIGTLRFQAPAAPQINRTRAQNASDVICPQAYPKWYTTGALTQFTSADIPPVDPRTSEDCLFLDVLLPARVWQDRRQSRTPVLVWIHGGGFDIGWKDASGGGYGLVSRSQQISSQGVILVSINYRLGLFGWMNGPGVISNLGLLDQRFGLEWVQKNIHLFGGDPAQVTVLGESAGASSIEAHITAYGGSKGRSLFKGAIMQSPFILPSSPQPSSGVNGILNFGNITSLNALRTMSSASLLKLNTLLIGNSRPFGNFTFGIVTDNEYVPDLPGKLLKQGRFDKNLSIMTGQNQDEGSRFVQNTATTNEASYTSYLESLLMPLAKDPAAMAYITKTLYPPVFNGSAGYTNQTQRNNMTVADAAVVCNTRFLNQANFSHPTYAYQFSVPPAIHGLDLLYTFYDFGPAPGVNTTVAELMQHYIARFAQTGQPNAPGLPVFPQMNPGSKVQKLGSDFVGPISDGRGAKRLSDRCRFWQDPSYLET